MKIFLRPLLVFYLKALAKLLLWFKQPQIIAIAGSNNKTFTKNQIKKTLQAKQLICRASPKSYNTDIGLSLSILGIASGYSDYKKWGRVLIQALAALFRPGFPDYLILEIGIAQPGDMKQLLSIIKPRISIITDLTQKYLEAFQDMDYLVKEYQLLFKKTNPKGFLIVNFDNPRLRQLAKTAGSTVISFGQARNYDYRITRLKRKNYRERIVIKHQKHSKLYQLKRYGLHNIYAFCIAVVIKQIIKTNKQDN
ncbi:MAG: hypothetical protein GF332_00155 [Candidatus Moranbacteria bacterium]|nr:hypothetical protein [Candidatus Moranbacteria bacterium]